VLGTLVVVPNLDVCHFVMVTCWSVIFHYHGWLWGHRSLHQAVLHVYVEYCKYPSFASPYCLLRYTVLMVSINSTKVSCLSLILLFFMNWLSYTSIACMVMLDVCTMGGSKLFQLLFCFLNVYPEVIEVNWWTWLRSDVWSALIVLSITLSDHSTCCFPISSEMCDINWFVDSMYHGL
jgi:hypothetical protein